MKRNAELQQISIVRAVEMGQLATEEMANMREEYLKREHDVRANMEMHINGLQAFQYKSSNLIIESQALVRAEVKNKNLLCRTYIFFSERHSSKWGFLRQERRR